MDFNTELRGILAQNNILLHKEMEEKEYEYYTIKFQKEKGGIYVTDSKHPLLVDAVKNINIVQGKAVFTKFQFEMVSELLRLEQANIIVIDEIN